MASYDCFFLFHVYIFHSSSMANLSRKKRTKKCACKRILNVEKDVYKEDLG